MLKLGRVFGQALPRKCVMCDRLTVHAVCDESVKKNLMCKRSHVSECQYKQLKWVSVKECDCVIKGDVVW